ncbi:MAG: hypothetical protein LC791_00450, partial [Acidobacteria bacterium]|nr:hypothetical protein [Acidobacteriota bacterium]
EWGKVGGTRVVNGDRVTGAPVTLKLENMPERQALEIILRSVAGYMAAPRSASAAPGASMYDRIMVLPTSTPPPPVAAAGNRNTPPRFVPPRPGESSDDPAMEQPVEGDPGAVFSFPQPGQFPGAFGQPGAPQAQPQPGNNPFAPTQPQATPFGQPGATMPFVPVPPGQTPFGTPVQPGTTPFGTPIQPGTAPPGQAPAGFNFTPQVQPTNPAEPPAGSPVIGTPVPGAAPPSPQRPPRD